MSNAYTSTELLASLKRRGLIPSSASTFAATDFYKIVDEETQTYIVPLLMETREEYLVATEDVTVTAGTESYYIPERAIANKLRDVTFDGRSMIRLEPENLDSVSTDISGPGGFYLQGNAIVLPNTASGTMTVSYYQRPNRVVATSSVGEITAINTGTGAVTIGTPPSAFTTSITYDFVKGKPGFDTLAKDLTATAVGVSSVTFTPANLPTGLAVGDFVCIAKETPIAQVPVELHPLLSERVAATVLHALGDAKAEAHYRVAADMEKRILKMLQPRTEGANRYIVNKHGVGWGRFNSRRGW